MDDLRAEVEAYERQTETFRRFHELVKRGYRPDWSVTVEAVWFDHPGLGPGITVYPDGMVVARAGLAILDPTATEDANRIMNQSKADDRLFDQWLATVPLPTWRERTRADRERFIYEPGCMVLFLLVSVGLAAVIQWLWRAITN